GNPNVAGDAANWWRAVGAVADIVYEAYYNAQNIDRLGPILGPRRVRLGMRSIVGLYTGIGIAPARLGFVLGFQVALGAAGREGPTVLPAAIHCAFDGGEVTDAAVKGVDGLIRDPHLAVTAAFARAVLRAHVPVSQAQIVRLERSVVKRAFHGSERAYLRALA